MLQLRGSGNDRHGTFVVFGVCRPDNGRLAFTKRYTSGGNNSVQYSGSIAASHDGRRPLGYELSGSWVLSGVTDRFLVWPTHSLGSVPPPADVASLQPEAWATQYVNSGGGAPVPVAAGDLLNFTGHFFERGQTTPMNFQAQWSSPYSQPGQPQYPQPQPQPQYPQQHQPQHSTLKVSGVGVDSQMFTMEGVLQLSNGRIALVKRYLNSQSVFHYSGTVTSSPQRPLGFEIAGTWQGSRAGTFQLFPSSVSSSTNMPATQPLGASEQQFIEEWTAAHHPGAPVTVPTDSWLYMNGNYVDNNQLLNLSLKLRFEVLSRVRYSPPKAPSIEDLIDRVVYIEALTDSSESTGMWLDAYPSQYLQSVWFTSRAERDTYQHKGHKWIVRRRGGQIMLESGRFANHFVYVRGANHRAFLKYHWYPETPELTDNLAMTWNMSVQGRYVVLESLLNNQREQRMRVWGTSNAHRDRGHWFLGFGTYSARGQVEQSNGRIENHTYRQNVANFNAGKFRLKLPTVSVKPSVFSAVPDLNGKITEIKELGYKKKTGSTITNETTVGGSLLAEVEGAFSGSLGLTYGHIKTNINSTTKDSITEWKVEVDKIPAHRRIVITQYNGQYDDIVEVDVPVFEVTEEQA